MTNMVAPGEYDLGDGRTLHVWTSGTDEDQQLWACSVYDHGPFCRLCQRVDDVLSACLGYTIAGRLECKQEADGEFSFKAIASRDVVRAMMRCFWSDDD